MSGETTVAEQLKRLWADEPAKFAAIANQIHALTGARSVTVTEMDLSQDGELTPVKETGAAKIIAGLQEAVDVARGDDQPSVVHIRPANSVKQGE